MTTIPRTMKAVLLKGHGGLDQLEYREDVSVPLPRDGEVLIHIGAAGVNNTDINTRAAWYSKGVNEGTNFQGATTGYANAKQDDSSWVGQALEFPRIQGADACGRIVAIGKGIDPARIGMRVLVDPLLRQPLAGGGYRVGYFGSECDGAFAEYARVASDQAREIRTDLPDTDLASFPCSYSAGENMLVRADVRAGEIVVVTGASGGVGSAAVQLARRRGARVAAVASASKFREIKALGAEWVIPRGDSLLDHLGSQEADVVLDVVGGPQWPELLHILKRGGRYAVAGAIAGPLVTLDLRTLYLKDLQLLGCTVFEPGVFENVVTYIERGEITPLVARVFPLAKIVEAQQEFLAKGFVGKIVLVP